MSVNDVQLSLCSRQSKVTTDFNIILEVLTTWTNVLNFIRALSKGCTTDRFDSIFQEAGLRVLLEQNELRIFGLACLFWLLI